ncbi:MAG: membrane protein insertion efficiency factor YidD [Candidatus Bipolaricaulota bacterium]|nr:membrane protein insertion efficiency factor YidD [Candidatus Bipolaricaulota bacterium]MDW8140952.1 membrane protein insertion efficiency factor YidD [Candidatus Bipolaricaulota bacterium]
MRSLVLLLIVTYQKLLSPLLPSVCRFYPSCSEYAKQAIERYGLVKGGWQALKRIVRCHPGHPGGFDPVP